MKPIHPWHHTRFGAACLWLGSIQVAIPILVLVTLALIAGTYIESTQSGRAARALVYGSWWFIALMALVCMSLVFAVATRYPWQRRHIGFMTVHASLVALIAGGFWSLFGRVEGRITLEQGSSGSSIEMDEDIVELVEHDNGQFRLLGAARAPMSPGGLTVGGFKFLATEWWPNSREEFEILDDGPQPYRAVEISLDPKSPKGFWIGEERVGGAAKVDDLVIRLLGPDSTWEPPAKPETAGEPGYAFLFSGRRITVGEAGAEVIPGWTISSRREFMRAKVTPEGLADAPDQIENPALEVVITDGKGTVERHVAFRNFPDMIVTKTIEGEAKSGARLAWGDAEHVHAEETLVLFGPIGSLRGGHISKTGDRALLEPSASLPWSFDLDGRRIIILREFTRARERSTFVRAEPAENRRPVLVVGAEGGPSPTPLAWKSMIPAGIPGRNAMLRYGPRTVPLPFTVRLDEFRKTDYPGTEMAMAYESSVHVAAPGQPDVTTTISMNNPLVHSGWKVYQSGFVGKNISIFSVMRDPGLPLTYLSSTTLCIGICITFYGRGRGHPGIPPPFARKEPSHGASPPRSVVRDDAAPGRDREAVLAGLDGSPGVDPDPGRRADHAAGVVRQ